MKIIDFKLKNSKWRKKLIEKMIDSFEPPDKNHKSNSTHCRRRTLTWLRPLKQENVYQLSQLLQLFPIDARNAQIVLNFDCERANTTAPLHKHCLKTLSAPHVVVQADVCVRGSAQRHLDGKIAPAKSEQCKMDLKRAFALKL